MSDFPDYSREGYEEFLNLLKNHGYKFIHFSDTTVDDPLDPFVVLLRHDVDKSPQSAYEMALIEREMGVKSTYFFLLHSPLYSLLETETNRIVREIDEMGHHVGLHCDERFLKSGKGNEDVEERVCHEIDLMSSILEQEVNRTVSFHNPSEHVLNRDFNQFRNTYGPDYFDPRVHYVSDSNQHWRENTFVNDVKKRVHEQFQILIHPLWWMIEGSSAVEIIEEIVQKRGDRMNEYLQKSNRLWKKHHE